MGDRMKHVLKVGCAILLSISALPRCSGSSSVKGERTDMMACVPGRQVQCACTDGRTSSQVCDAAGAEYLPCDCPVAGGASGGSEQAGSHSGEGGASGVDVGGTSNGGLGGAVGGTTDGGHPTAGTSAAGTSTAGTSTGGVSTGGTSAEDAPCPVGDNIVNCSDTCDNPIRCRVSRCTDAPDYDSITIDEVPAVVRTPSAPGDKDCTPCPQDGPSAVANITLKAFIPGSYRIEVDPPWYVMPVSGGTCMGKQCLWWGLDVLIVTADPNAPARNVYITEAPPDTCL